MPARAAGEASTRDRCVRESAVVSAPLERCWALSTRVELVRETLGMKLVGGVTSGFITAGSRVVWRGWKFGLPTNHHTLITGFEAPRPARPRDDSTAGLEDGATLTAVAFFQDSQERGRFASFYHQHHLREWVNAGGKRRTTLEDHVFFRLPLGWAGDLVARLVMAPYVRKLARKRFGMIRELAEGEGWRAWM